MKDSTRQTSLQILGNQCKGNINPLHITNKTGNRKIPIHGMAKSVHIKQLLGKINDIIARGDTTQIEWVVLANWI